MIVIKDVEDDDADGQQIRHDENGDPPISGSSTFLHNKTLGQTPFLSLGAIDQPIRPRQLLMTDFNLFWGKIDTSSQLL